GLPCTTLRSVRSWPIRQRRHMMNKKTFLGAALAIALTSATAWSADYTMRISHQFPPSHHTSPLLEQFAKDVAAETDGKVEVQLFGAAQLYKPQQHHAAVASGQIEAAIILSIQWGGRSEEHTSELQSRENLVCRLLLEKKNK